MVYLTADLSLYQSRTNFLVLSGACPWSLLMHMCISYYWRPVNLQHPGTLEQLVKVKKNHPLPRQPQEHREKKTDGTYLQHHYSEMSFPRGPKPWSTHLFVWRTPHSPGSSWTPEPQGPCTLLCQPTGEEIGETSGAAVVIHVLDSAVI